MRLSASRLCVLPGLALALCAQQVHASTCKTLLDVNIPLIDDLAEWTEQDLSNFPSATVFEEIDTAMPWLSKCAAAIDPKALVASFGTSTSVQTCIKDIENADSDVTFYEPEDWMAACSLVKKTVKPCLTNAMTEIVMDAFASTGGCCDDFLAEVTTLFGDSLDVMVEKLLVLAGNAMCAKRTFTNLAGKSKTEVCGYSVYNSFRYLDHVEDIESSLLDLLNLVELPNIQMCKAFAGKEFVNTKGEKITLGFGTDGIDAMGICLQPLDAFVQYLASWPIFAKTLDTGSTTFTLKNLFTTGKSVNGSLLLSWATLAENLPMMFVRMDEKVFTAMGIELNDSSSSTALEEILLGAVETLDMDSYARQYLLHIPNNGNCTYTGQTIVLPYTYTATPSTTTATPGATTATTTTSAATMTSFSMLIAVGVATISSLLF